MAIYDPTTPEELWYDIPSLPGHQFSSEFRVRSWKTTNSKKRRVVPKILSVYTSTRGYQRFHIRINGKSLGPYIHHIVAELAYGAIPSNENIARHYNDDKSNNYSSNVVLGTHKDNVADSARNGTKCRGERHPDAKVTEDDVRAIRRRLKAGETSRALAKEYKMGTSNMARIKLMRIWKHVV